MNNSLDFSFVTIEDARSVLDDGALSTRRHVRATDVKWLRRPSRPEDRALTPAAQMWFVGLPMAVRPQECAKRFPRIVNRMQELSSDGARLSAYLEELAEDRREGRQGFPGRIPAELSVLREHFTGVQSESGIAWKPALRA